MILGFKNQAELVQRCVQTLSAPEHACILLVLPPGFGEDEVAKQIVEGLQSHPTQPRVALVSPDDCADTDHYVERLHEQWSIGGSLPRPKRQHYASDRLWGLIEALPEKPVAIQIIKHFQGMVGEHISKETLARLHTAEEAKRVRTLNIAPYPYSDLRARWKSQGHHFCTSPYGGFHVQEGRIEPLAPDEAVKIATKLGIPRYVAERFIAWTGACPEPFELLCSQWRHYGTPHLVPEENQRFWEIAKESFTRLLEWIGPLGEPYYVQYLADLGYGACSPEALSALNGHRWRHALLVSHKLRAECIGEAALDHLARRREGASRAALPELARLARLFYERRQFATADRLLRNLDDASTPPRVRVLKANSHLMALLCGSGGETFHIDADWKRLGPALIAVRESFVSAQLTAGEREQLAGCLASIETVVAGVKQAVGRDSRVGDVLFGLRINGTSVARPQAAVLLLFARFEAARRMAGDTAACIWGLPLPEQIFRGWAFLALGINFYSAPKTDPTAWDLVIQSCSHQRYPDGPTPFEPGEQFPSFDLFSRYALALHFHRNPLSHTPRPEPDMKDLDRSLSKMTLPRNDGAHSFAYASPADRKNYFEIIDRWMHSLIAVCPGGISVKTLRAQMRPLPILSEDGSLVWLND